MLRNQPAGRSRRDARPGPRDRMPLWAAFVTATATLLASVVTVIGIVTSADPEPAAAPPGATAEFTNLNNGQAVRPDERSVSDPSRGARYAATGTVRDLLPATRLICFVRDESSSYFAYEVSEADGRWTADIGLGPSGIDGPRPFTVVLAALTPAAAAELDSLRNENPDKYYDSGIGPDLPSGTIPLAGVSVTRAPSG